VKQLLDGDGGAHVDEKDEDGETALIWASHSGHTRGWCGCCSTRARKGRAARREEQMGQDRADACERQRPHGGGAAAARHHKGALVDEKNEEGDTALRRASINSHTEAVKLLLERGASVDNMFGGPARAGRPCPLPAGMYFTVRACTSTCTDVKHYRNETKLIIGTSTLHLKGK
jgi:hypothetical protein